MRTKLPARRARTLHFKALAHTLAEALHEARPVRYHLAIDDPAAYVAAAAWEAAVYAVENRLAMLHPRFDRRLFECDAGCEWLSETAVPRVRMTIVKTDTVVGGTKEEDNGQAH